MCRHTSSPGLGSRAVDRAAVADRRGEYRVFTELLVSVEPHLLDLRLAGRQPDVPALVGLITIEPATGHPFSLRIEHAFIREVESGVDPALDDSRRRYYRLTAAGRTAAASEAERLAAVVKVARARQLATVAHEALAHEI